jgi:hypothetical protein
MRTNHFRFIKLLCLFFFTAFLSCGSNKHTNTYSETQPVSCPENGICTFELLQNKRLEIKKDAFGKTYYSLEDDATKNTIRYVYTLNNDKNIQDSSYREEVVFEVNSDEMIIKKAGTELQKTKMLFGRFCFCRGATGYYKVEEGKLLLKKNKESYTIDLGFRITEVPQIVTKINGVVK